MKRIIAMVDDILVKSRWYYDHEIDAIYENKENWGLWFDDEDGNGYAIPPVSIKHSEIELEEDEVVVGTTHTASLAKAKVAIL